MLYMYSYEKKLERTAGAIRNGQFIDTANMSTRNRRKTAKMISQKTRNMSIMDPTNTPGVTLIASEG